MGHLVVHRLSEQHLMLYRSRQGLYIQQRLCHITEHSNIPRQRDGEGLSVLNTAEPTPQTLLIQRRG